MEKGYTIRDVDKSVKRYLEFTRPVLYEQNPEDSKVYKFKPPIFPVGPDLFLLELTDEGKAQTSVPAISFLSGYSIYQPPHEANVFPEGRYNEETGKWEEYDAVSSFRYSYLLSTYCTDPNQHSTFFAFLMNAFRRGGGIDIYCKNEAGEEEVIATEWFTRESITQAPIEITGSFAGKRLLRYDVVMEANLGIRWNTDIREFDTVDSLVVEKKYIRD